MTPQFIGGKRAQEIGRWLARVESTHGHITPQIVVSEARSDKACAAHSYFNWDVQSAAQAHWLWQARQLIATVKVVYDHNPKNTPPVRGIINVRRYADDETYTREYISTARALSDKELRSQVLDRAKGELAEWRHRYRNLAELSEVFVVIDRTIQRKARKKSA
jgi:hypothetical protein